MHLEFNNITDMLLKNGYPLYFIQNQIRRFLGNKCYKSNLNKMSRRYSPSSYYFKIALYWRSFTLCEKELQTFFHRYLSDNLSLNVVHNCFKIGDMFKHKEHQPKLLSNNVVYKLTCSCDSVYIGQTRRILRARLDDDNPAANSNQQFDVAKHLFANPIQFY